MTISLRRVTGQEAREMFEKVQQPASDLLLDMCLKIVRERSALRNRTLVAHLRAWEREALAAPWDAQQIDELAVARALVFLATEAEDRPRSSPAEQAAWARHRLAQLLAESAATNEETKQEFSARVQSAQKGAAA